MAGHNKWTQIKRQKGVEDAKKSKIFGMLAKAIALELKKAAGDKNAAGVKKAIEKARAANMPNANIERALGASENKTLEEVSYEAFGPGGVAIVITAITDNRNRTNQELKHLASEFGVSLIPPGGAAWALGTPTALGPAERARLDEMLAALEAHDDVNEVKTNAA